MKARILKNLLAYHRNYAVQKFASLDAVAMQRVEKSVRSVQSEMNKLDFKKYRFKKGSQGIDSRC